MLLRFGLELHDAYIYNELTDPYDMANMYTSTLLHLLFTIFIQEKLLTITQPFQTFCAAPVTQLLLTFFIRLFIRLACLLGIFLSFLCVESFFVQRLKAFYSPVYRKLHLKLTVFIYKPIQDWNYHITRVLFNKKLENNVSSTGWKIPTIKSKINRRIQQIDHQHNRLHLKKLSTPTRIPNKIIYQSEPFPYKNV